MPKMKSHSGAKKRFKKVGNGKIKRAQGYRRHHAWAKSAKQVRQLRSTAYLEGGDLRNVEQMLPY